MTFNELLNSDILKDVLDHPNFIESNTHLINSLL